MLDQKDNLLSSYNYDLPNDLIAQSPTKSRHDAKLMIVKDGLDDSLNLVHAKFPKLPGNMCEAMQQKTLGSTPRDWTPVHFLRDRSDRMQQKASLVRDLLRAGVLQLGDFNEPNDKVFYF